MRFGPDKGTPVSDAYFTRAPADRRLWWSASATRGAKDLRKIGIHKFFHSRTVTRPQQLQETRF